MVVVAMGGGEPWDVQVMLVGGLLDEVRQVRVTWDPSCATSGSRDPFSSLGGSGEGRGKV